MAKNSATTPSPMLITLMLLVGLPVIAVGLFIGAYTILIMVGVGFTYGGGWGAAFVIATVLFMAVYTLVRICLISVKRGQ